MKIIRSLMLGMLASCCAGLLCRAQSGNVRYGDYVFGTGSFSSGSGYPAPNSPIPPISSGSLPSESRFVGKSKGRSGPQAAYPLYPILGDPLWMIEGMVERTQVFPFSGDRFIPALGYYLYGNDLSAKRVTRVSDYRIEKQRILAELRSGIDRISQAAPAERAALYSQLANRQRAEILALEAKEEEIRRELSSGLFDRDVDRAKTMINAYKGSEPGSYIDYSTEHKLLIAFADHQEGLTAPQRDLLREIAMDNISKMGHRAPKSSDSAFEMQESPTFFFSPSPSRLRLPSVLPEELKTRIIQYQDHKASMKRALRDLVNAAFDKSARTRNKLAIELATRQAEQFSELDRLAEELRIDLTTLKLPAEPDIALLLGHRAAEASAYLQARADLWHALLLRTIETKAILPLDRVEIVPMEGGFGVEILRGVGKTKDQTVKRQTQLALLKSFNQEKIQKYKLLATQKNLLARQLGNPAADATKVGNSGGQLPPELTEVFARIETWNLYKDYRVAVLEPGLSPEQRRLLYGSALEILMACVNR